MLAARPGQGDLPQPGGRVRRGLLGPEPDRHLGARAAHRDCFSLAFGAIRDWRGTYSVRRVIRRGPPCPARVIMTISSRETSASRHAADRARERQHARAI